MRIFGLPKTSQSSDSVNLSLGGSTCRSIWPIRFRNELPKLFGKHVEPHRGHYEEFCCRCLLEFEGVFFIKNLEFSDFARKCTETIILVRKCEGLGRPEIFSFSKIVFGRVGWYMLSISSQLLVLQVACWQASKSAAQLFGKCVEPHQGSL